MRFARSVQFKIKGGKETELKNVFEKEVVPMLRKQTGDTDQPEGSQLHQPLG